MSDMPRPRPPFLHCEISRHGKRKWYVRRGHGPRIRIEGEYGSPEFTRAYEAAVRGEAPAGLAKGADGSFAWALWQYRKSQAWAALSQSSRERRERVFQAIEASHGATSLRAWKRGDIVAGRDKRAASPNTARLFVETLRGLFKWALDAAIIGIDPTEGVKVVRPETDGFEPWTETDLEKFRLRWPVGTRERVAMEVLRWTGLRRGDAVRLGRPHLRAGVIRITTEKTGERVAIAYAPELADIIDAGPIGELTFIAGERGLPMTKESFGNWFRGACSAAKVTKAAHGLRKYGATVDALAGFTDAELDAKYGWQGRRMASLYTRAANREKLSLGAAARAENVTPIPAPVHKVRARARKP